MPKSFKRCWISALFFFYSSQSCSSGSSIIFAQTTTANQNLFRPYVWESNCTGHTSYVTLLAHSVSHSGFCSISVYSKLFCSLFFIMFFPLVSCVWSKWERTWTTFALSSAWMSRALSAWPFKLSLCNTADSIQPFV